jgi:hypothetical protein
MTYKTILLTQLLLCFFLSCQGPQKNPEQLKKEKEIARIEAEKEKLRQDSLSYYTSTAEEQFKLKKYDIEKLYLDSALVYALDSDKSDLIYKKAEASFLLKMYDESISFYTDLIAVKYNLKDTYYQRALCYLKERKTQESVDDLVQAMLLENKDAESLHEKINPLKKRVSYYITRCCDGTTSNATGRGACSHHDGVCDWNEPVYEEYRKY